MSTACSVANLQVVRPSCATRLLALRPPRWLACSWNWLEPEQSEEVTRFGLSYSVEFAAGFLWTSAVVVVGCTALELVWAGLGWAGLDWAGLGWTGLGWAGLDWAGLGWIGLDWTGLGWTPPKDSFFSPGSLRTSARALHFCLGRARYGNLSATRGVE